MSFAATVDKCKRAMPSRAACADNATPRKKTAQSFYSVVCHIDVMRRGFIATALLLVVATASSSSHAAEPRVVDVLKDGHNIVAALINMDEISDDCSQMIGPIKVEGIQFSQSGATNGLSRLILTIYYRMLRERQRTVSLRLVKLIILIFRFAAVEGLPAL